MNIDFRPIDEAGFGLVKKWLKMPHVREFWDAGEKWAEPYEVYVHRTASDAVKQFIIYVDGVPVGYIQYYWASKVGDGWWEGFDDQTIGTDQYIGEPDYLGKGYGTKIISQFLGTLFDTLKVSRVIVDPSPDNVRAIRCYEKVGFKKTGLIDTPDGKAVLMEYRR